MMGLAFQAGIDPLQFWELTPNELSVCISAFAEKMKHENEQQLVVAYLTAYWHRVKKMPSIKEVLGNKSQKRKKSPEEMLETVKRLNEAFGGTVSG